LTPGRNISLFIDPFSYHFLRDHLFDPSVEKFNSANILAPRLFLQDWLTRRGVSVHTADHLLEEKFVSARNIFVWFGMRERYRSAAKLPNVDRSASFAFESPAAGPGTGARL